jgi:hypothetical protein
MSKTSFDIEQTIFQKEIGAVELKHLVFVTGLARAGTTALFNAIYNTSDFASLKYSNMPFLLMPNLWKQLSPNKKATELTERAHKDGIKVNSESPEAFDEYFWKTVLDNNYIHSNNLSVHSISNETLVSFENYTKAICLSSKKTSYLSKNNNNGLRILSILEYFRSSIALVVYRNPLDHAKSLLKQHQSFSTLQTDDPFALDYFNYLGHHEFGLNHKYFRFNENELQSNNLNNLDYWLENWLHYYTYMLSIQNDRILFVSFEDLCADPLIISNFLNQKLNLEHPISISEKYIPIPHKEINHDEELKKKCDAIYNALNSQRKYLI